MAAQKYPKSMQKNLFNVLEWCHSASFVDFEHKPHWFDLLQSTGYVEVEKTGGCILVYSRD